MSEEKIHPATTLTSNQKQFLKGLAHSLRPIVQIGKEGISARIIETIANELKNHELIKVKIGSNSGLEKNSTCQTVVDQTASTIVQLIGKTIVLYKANPKRPKEKRITLPKVKKT
jgi:RNA-binding protein